MGQPMRNCQLTTLLSHIKQRFINLMDIYFDLGKFYFQEQKYEEAFPYIELVIKMNPRRIETLREAEMLKIEAGYGIEAMKTPLNFKVSKLVSEINYFQGNYLPSVTADNSTFLYTGLSINFKTGYRNEKYSQNIGP